MTSLELMQCIGQISDCHISEAQHLPVKTYRSKRKLVCLIAAIVGILALLAGCAVWVYRLEQLVAVDHAPDMAASENPFVAEKILSIQGYEGSPAYSALQEWLTYEADYIRKHPEARFHSDFTRPDAYEHYACYSQEMVDKVDEICRKYGLHILGKSTFLKNVSEMEGAGLTHVLSPDAVTRCFLGSLFEDGSFVADGELVLNGYNNRVIQFQMHNIRKDAFYTTHLGINGLSAYTQWNYRTKDGALLALNTTTGLIIAENADRFITVIIEEVPDDNMVWHGLPDDKAFLEAVCDCFCFS